MLKLKAVRLEKFKSCQGDQFFYYYLDIYELAERSYGLVWELISQETSGNMYSLGGLQTRLLDFKSAGYVDLSHLDNDLFVRDSQSQDPIYTPFSEDHLKKRAFPDA